MCSNAHTKTRDTFISAIVSVPVNWRSEEGKTLPASRSLRKQAETYDVAASLKRGCGAVLISE